jgi:2-desacetyl-2-hydroxyethyl bacteriochlorophyllide A dehydrogenase
MNSLQAIVFPAPGQVELRTFPIPEPQTGELLVKIRYTMVSSGTELRVLSGNQRGHDFPLIPGYVAVGEVVQIGPETPGWKAGDLVCCRNPKELPDIGACWGGQASYHIQPATGDGRPVLLPAEANLLDYVVAELGAISWRGAEAVNPKPGETAVVIGQGLIGALSAAWFQLLGCRVIVVDLSDYRLERALARGAAGAVNATSGDAKARLQNLCPGAPPIVVEASGSIPGVQLAYSLVNSDRRQSIQSTQFPRLLLQATYSAEVTHHPFDFFGGEGVTLITPSDRTYDNRQKVVEHIRRGRFNSADFLDRILPVGQAPTAYLELRDNPDKYFSLVFDWAQS